jgi:hypothetical protein
VIGLADILTLTGGLCEAAGIALTVRELVRVENRTFPERRSRILRAWRRAQAWLRGERSTTVQLMGGDVAAAGEAASLRIDLDPVDPDDLKARIARLETVVDRRDLEHREALTNVQKSVSALERRLAERFDAIEHRLARERDEERALLRDSLTMQKGYVLLFSVGVALTTWGGVIG